MPADGRQDYRADNDASGMNSETIDVLEFVNVARDARGLRPLAGIRAGGCERTSNTECLLARALECEVRCVDRTAWGDDALPFCLSFVDPLIAELVATATGQPYRGRQVLLPDGLIDLIVSFDFGCVLSDPDGMLVAWAVPAGTRPADWTWFGVDGDEVEPDEVPEDVCRSLRRAASRYCGSAHEPVGA
jgi:hypothetical protein